MTSKENIARLKAEEINEVPKYRKQSGRKRFAIHECPTSSNNFFAKAGTWHVRWRKYATWGAALDAIKELKKRNRTRAHGYVYKIEPI